MVNNTVVLPIACLSGICVAMLIFIWWFFPKWYKKGVEADMRDMDEMLAERRAVAAANAARAADTQSSNGDVEAQRQDSATDAAPTVKVPQVNQHTYRPPPIATF